MDNDNQILPKFNDLLIVTSGLKQKCFGLQQSKQRLFKRDCIHPSLVSQFYSQLPGAVCFELTIFVAGTNWYFAHGMTLQVQVVTSLISNLRRLRALASLPSLTLAKGLLSPNSEDDLFSLSDFTFPSISSIISFLKTFLESNQTQNPIGNSSQQRVIREATSMVCDSFLKNDKVYMVQGPPGTGKSHTIVGIIRSIAQKWNYSVKMKKLKILVCAPSNGACNEITRKLLAQSEGLKIIRLGRDEGRTTQSELPLQQISLETIAEQRLKEDPFLSPQNRTKRTKEIKQKIMEEADVVVCTLNYSGNPVFDPFCFKPSQRSSFDCLIVDEAGQCLEVDIFIPLRLGIRRILLVGDPEQLPPTVIASCAQNAKFGQSLLERLYSLFKSKDLIRMLDIQYRMAEEICRFPSDHIYGGRLLTDEDTQRERARFHLRPYVFINVPNSIATLHTTSQSYSNRPEAKCIIQLVGFLRQQANVDLSSIGIITPYKQQVELVKSQIGSQLDIGTVDGFQGREKDIILLSTVRAHTDDEIRPTIGFVKDRRRLNVALTRGKYAVYVIGHAKSLSINGDWNALIQDARNRGCIFDYSPRQSFNFLRRI